MAIASDVLVVGGGLAGTTAAIAAAREGAAVRLVSKATSTLRQASGTIDALGYVPDVSSGPLSNPYDGIADLPDGHPYSVVGAGALREGLALFDGVVGDRYRGEHTDRNALVPTVAGTVKPTARYPASMAAGLASDERPALLAGLSTMTAFDARLVADQLSAAGVPFDVSGVEVPFAESLREDALVTRIARALDGDEPIDGTPAREALAAAVEPHLDGAERLGLPAVLGMDDAEGVREELRGRLGVEVFELPAVPPSVPGLRLEARLREELEAAGVRYETGVPVVDYEADGDRIAAATVERNGTTAPYAADAYVLATGGLVGKGIEADRDGVCEPVFDCHVPHPDDRYEWFVDDAFGDQPYARFGVRTDGELRPLAADGKPSFENLRAAGAVLGGADVARENSAAGVSLATGIVAGRNAAREAGA